MLQYLHDTLGIDAFLTNFNDKNKLPFYLTETYQFFVLKILEQEFIYLEIIDKLPTTSNIKKHINTIHKKCNMSCILGVSKITRYQRKRLIEERISFIDPFRQLFVPCLGLSLTEKIKQTEVAKSTELFTPATQVLFLHLLYGETFRMINSTDAAKKLRYSKMTMTRAFTELQNLGLVTAKTEGTKKIYSATDTPKVLLEKGKKFLRSPVAKKVYTNNKELLENTLISGLQALSHKTMLNPPRYQIRAIQKDDKRLGNIALYNQDHIDNDLDFELELWDYDPNMFSKDGVVDHISLIVALQDTKDERVQIEIKELLESYKW